MKNIKHIRLMILPLLALLGAAFGGGWMAGHEDQRSITDAATRVIAEYRTYSDTQAQIIEQKDATIDALRAELAAVSRAAKPEGTKARDVLASWYGPGLYGNYTADGTLFTPETWGVAHKTLPFGTMLEITFRGVTIEAPVKDRGPFVPGRELDLSNAVANALNFHGVQEVSYRVLDDR